MHRVILNLGIIHKLEESLRNFERLHEENE